MPTYSIEDPDGRTHTIDGPEGATREQIIAEIQRQLPHQQRTVSEQLPIDYREDTLGRQFKRGLGRAFEGTKSTVTDLIPALVGSAVGAKGYAAEQLAEHKAKMDAAEAQYPTAFQSYKDVRGIGDVPGFIAETLGELGPDIAALMTGTGVASVAGKRIALRGVEELATKTALEKAAASGLTGEAATLFKDTLVKGAVEKAAAEGAAAGLKYGLPASSYALNAPGTFESVYEATGEQHPAIAAAMGVPIAMLDTFLPGRIMAKLGNAGKARLAEEVIAKSSLPDTFKMAAAKEFSKVIAGEGLTESGQEALTIAAEMIAGAKGDFFSTKNIDRMVNAGIKGAIGGGAFGGPGAIKEGLASRAEGIRREEEQKALDAEEAKRPPFELTSPPSEAPRPDFELAPSTVPEAEDTRQASFDFGSPPPAPSSQQELDLGAPPAFRPSEERAEAARRQAQDQQTPKAGERYLKQSAFAEEQPDLLGEFAPAPSAPTEEAAPVLTRGMLTELGIPKNAPVVTRLDGLDLSEPENRSTAIKQLAAFAANPMVVPEVKARVIEFAKSLQEAPSTQQGALQFAPAAPEGPVNTQMPDQLAVMQRQQQEQAAYQQRQQQQAQEQAAKQQDVNRLGNLAAAQREYEYSQQQEATNGTAPANTAPADTGLINPPAGVSTNVSGEPSGVAVPSSAGVAAPESGGMGNAGVPSDIVAGGTKAASRALKPKRPIKGFGAKKVAPVVKAEPTQPEVKVEVKPEVKAKPKVEATRSIKKPEVKKAAPVVKVEAKPEVKVEAKPVVKDKKPRKVKTVVANSTPKMESNEFTVQTAKAYEDTPELDEPRSIKAVAQLVASKPTTPEAKAANVYFSKRLGPYKLQVIDSLKNIAFDLVYNTPTMHSTKLGKYPEKETKAAVRETGLPVFTESAAEIAFFSNMNGANGRLAAQWVGENLDEKANAELAGFVADYTDQKIYYESEQYQRMLLKGTVDSADTRVIDATIRQYFEATQDTYGLTIEGQFSRVREQANLLIIKANKDLTEADVKTLEDHYQVPRSSLQYVEKLRSDILKYVTEGAASVAKSIRQIIQKLAVALLAVGIAFNQGNFVTDAKAFTMPLPQTKTEFVKVVEKPKASFGIIKPSATAAIVADWIVGTKDAKGKPFFVVDKPSATAYIFDAAGKLQGAAPVLLGQNSKADVLPASGINKTIEQTTKAEKVTPAGRFEGKVSPNAEYGSILTFLKLGNSVLAMHKTYLATASERRQQRLDTPTAEDNFVSYGCINIDAKFYKQFVETGFKDGGVMYITPMTQSLESTFQGLAKYTPTETIVTSIITNPQSAKDVSTHSELGAFRQRPATGKARKPSVTPSPANPNELALATSLNMPLHPGVIAALHNGDFAQAMQLMAQTKDPRTAKLATRLLRAAVNPSVKVVDNLKNEAGEAVAGLYDPRTNTITLDSVHGMTAHTLIHETGHAALSHVLADANHPVTKQMQRLLDDARPMLDTAYGAQDVQEFAAEALGNPEFRGKLNAMHPDGNKISLWQRFQNIVGSFFRRVFGLPGKPVESALDQVDKLIDQIISPAPEFRDAGSLYALAKQDKGMIAKAFDAAFQITEKLPYMRTEIGNGETRADLWREAITNASTDTARAGLLASLPLNILSELASKVVTNAKEINTLVNERAGVIHTRNEQIEALVNKADRWATAAGKGMVGTFNNVVYDSTTLGVDPTKNESEYEAKPGEDKKISPEARDEARKKLLALAEVKAEYAKLDTVGKALYVEMRNAYAKMYVEIERSLKARVVKALEGEVDAEKIKNELFRKLVERAHLDPYFPLTRSGSYWLAYDTIDEDGQADRVIRSFITESGRDRFITEESKSNKNATDFQKYSNLNQIRYNRVPSTSFISDVLKVLQKGAIDPVTGEKIKIAEDKIEAVVKLFLDTLPETAFAKSFQKRNKTTGFEKDAIGALRTKMFNTSRQIANMEYASKLDDALKEMESSRERIKNDTDTRVIDAYINEYRKRIAFINNPTISKASQFLTGLGFNFLLGLNPASAFVNLTQVPIVTLPYLGGEYGYPEASRAVMDAYKTFTGTGRSKTTAIFGSKDATETRAAMYSLDNLDSKSPMYAQYKTLIDVARAQGQISSSQVYDTLEVTDKVGLSQKVNAVTGWMFHQADRVNRQVTMIAAYNLEMAKLKKDGVTGIEAETKAANHAIYVGEITQGGTSAASAPRIAQNTVGRVMFMFKRYGVSMMYLQFKMLRDGLTGQDKSVKKAAMAQFAGVVGTSALFAGVQGLPFFGVAALIYNLFKDDDDDDLEMATRKYMGTMLTNGPLSYYTNLDFSGRVSMTDLLVKEVRTGSSPSFVASILEQLGGPVYGIASKIERGVGLMREGHTARGMEQILPSAFGNPLKAIRMYSEGANTLRGDPITGDVDAWNAAAQALGFSPADYQRQNELNSRLKEIDKRVSQSETKLFRQYYTAGRMGDTEAQGEIKEKLRDLFQRHPGLGNMQEALQRSMESHKKTSKSMIHGITVNEKLRSELQRYAADAEG
jgi:hypothetical protein